MDFAFSDEQSQIRELARKILEDRVTNDRLKEIEAGTPVFDRELWREFAQSNLLGVAVPERFGGMEFGFLELALLLQEVGRSVAPIPVYPSLCLGALPLAAWGSEAQQEAWLPKVVSGEAVLTAALTELDAEDPQRPTTTATAEGDGFRLRGHKSNVPALPVADAVLVPASVGGRIGLFLLSPQGPGVHVAQQAASDRQPVGALTLEDARVDGGALVGTLERGSEILAWLLRRATVGLAALQLGVSERALEMTAAYARERVQFDRPIGSFQAVHQRAADAWIQTEGIRLSVWESAWLLSQGREDDDAVASAKYWAAEGGQFTAYACQHLHGGIGIDVDYPLHRYFIWSTMLEHTLGSGPVHLAAMGAKLAAEGVPGR